MSNDRISGMVCKWIPSKGYGFIRIPGKDTDLYVHTTDVLPKERNNLHIGEIVSFVVYTNKKTGRTKAVKVEGNGGGFVVNEHSGFTGVAKQHLKNVKYRGPNPTRYQLAPVDNQMTTVPRYYEHRYLPPPPRHYVEHPAVHPNPPSDHHPYPPSYEHGNAAVNISVKPEEAVLWQAFKNLSITNNDTPFRSQPLPTNRPRVVSDEGIPPYIEPEAPAMLEWNEIDQEVVRERIPGGSGGMNNTGFDFYGHDISVSSTSPYRGGRLSNEVAAAAPTYPATDTRGGVMDYYPHLRYSNTSDGATTFPTGDPIDISRRTNSRQSYEWSIRNPYENLQ